MDTVKELFQSIYDSYRDRIKSPLIGSFIITYLIFNWRLVAILFYSEWPIHCRIEWIEENYCEWYHYVVPFLIALFYVMGLPYLNLGFEKILEKYTNTKFTKKNTSKLDALDQKIKEAKKKRLIADAEAGTSEINTLKERNEALQTENIALTTQNKDDLERHNKNLAQSKGRENGYLEQIRIYSAQTSLLMMSSELIDNVEVTFENTKNMLKIADGLSETAKSVFEKIVLSDRNSNEIEYTHEIPNFEKLGLIKVNVTTYERKTSVTPMGNLLFEYFKLGLDLF